MKIIIRFMMPYLVFLDLRKIIPIDKVKEFIQDKYNLAIDFGEWFGAN